MNNKYTDQQTANDIRHIAQHITRLNNLEREGFSLNQAQNILATEIWNESAGCFNVDNVAIKNLRK